MNLQSSPTPRLKPRSNHSTEAFLKSINKLASRDSFSPIELEPVTTKKSRYINKGTSIKVCTRCQIPLVAGENITQYRYNRYYFICTDCFSLLHRTIYRKKAPVKDLSELVQKKKVSLQKRIVKLMDQLNYLNACGY